MNNTLRVILAVATLVTVLACATCCVWAFATGKPVGLGLVAALLAGTMSIFVYNDYQYFFGKK